MAAWLHQRRELLLNQGAEDDTDDALRSPTRPVGIVPGTGSLAVGMRVKLQSPYGNGRLPAGATGGWI